MPGTALLALLVASCANVPVLPGPAGEVRALTGARTRVVWVQGDGTDPYAAGDQLVLMGFDTDDGRGERVILDARGSYVKPMLTPRGDRIVFSRRPNPDPEVFIVRWDGSGLRRLAQGFALTVWEDPADGSEWIYLGTDNEPRSYAFATVTRFPIDDPARRELVWNKTRVSGDTFQVSEDGRLAGGLFPWPSAGVAELPNGELRQLGDGCWTAMSVAGAPLCWYFDGAHRNVTIVDAGSGKRWMVGLNRAPGFEGAELYHPRWTNHPRFVAISGPYNQGGANQVRSGGTQAEIHLGRFSENFSRIEEWVRVTHNSGGDSYPDVWIERDRSSYALRPAGPFGPPAGSAPAAALENGRLVVEARLVGPGPIPTPQEIAPYRNALVVNAYEVVNVFEGTYGAQTILVAQWAIRDARVLATAHKRAGTLHRLTVEPYDAHPELEGERLITDHDELDLPVYFEVGP